MSGIAGGVLAVAAFAHGVIRPAATADDGSASEWAGQKVGRIRLLSGQPQGPGVTPVAGMVYAGIHIKLEPGWKTYWRLPGDSGVPPQFDWAGSANLGAARILYPAPIRLPEAGMISLGYKGEVVLPVEVTPIDAAKPVELRVTAEYGVCKDICIPAEAKLTLLVPPLAAQAAGQGALIGAHLARVPATGAAGGPVLRSVKAELDPTAPRLVLEASFPKGSDGADALIEIPGGSLAPLPVITQRRGVDGVRFEARFSSVAEAQLFAGKPLVVTLLSAAAQAEISTRFP